MNYTFSEGSYMKISILGVLLKIYTRVNLMNALQLKFETVIFRYLIFK